MAELNETCVQALIGSLQLTDDQVATFNNAEDKAKVSSEFFSNRKTSDNANFLELKLNDPEFKKPFYDAGYKEAQGKYINSGRESIKSFFGLPKEDVYDEHGKGYDYKKILQSGSEKMKLGSTPEGITELQEKHATDRKAWDTEKSSFESRIEEKDAFHNGYVSKHKISGLLKNELRKVERLKHNVDDASMLFIDRLNGFKIGLTEAGELEFKSKKGIHPEIDNKVVKDPGIYINHLCNEYEWINKEEEKKPIVPIKVSGDPSGEPTILTRRDRAKQEAELYDPSK